MEWRECKKHNTDFCTRLHDQAQITSVAQKFRALYDMQGVTDFRNPATLKALEDVYDGVMGNLLFGDGLGQDRTVGSHISSHFDLNNAHEHRCVPNQTEQTLDCWCRIPRPGTNNA